jgi:hypothetical protein
VSQGTQQKATSVAHEERPYDSPRKFGLFAAHSDIALPTRAPPCQRLPKSVCLDEIPNKDFRIFPPFAASSRIFLRGEGPPPYRAQYRRFHCRRAASGRVAWCRLASLGVASQSSHPPVRSSQVKASQGLQKSSKKDATRLQSTINIQPSTIPVKASQAILQCASRFS